MTVVAASPQAICAITNVGASAGHSSANEFARPGRVIARTVGLEAAVAKCRIIEYGFVYEAAH